MGVPTIGSKIVLEGEKEYREALKGIASGQKELRSEMKLSTETFSENQNSVDALKEKFQILTKQYELQAQKVKVYSEAIEDSTKKEEEAKEKVDTLSTQLQEAQKSMEEMAKSSNTSKEALDEQNKKIEDLQTKLSLAQQEYDKTSQKTSQWQTALNYAEADLVKLDNELSKTGGYLKEAQTSTDGCAKSIDNYGKKVKTATEESQQFSKKSQEAIGALATVLASAGISKTIEEIEETLIDCSKKAEVFETAVAKVGTVADNAVVSMDAMKAEMLQASSDLGIAAEGIADATYNAISAGVDTEKSVGFAGEATKLAIGGFTDATTSVDILTTTLNAYNLEMENTTKISDMLVTTQNLGKTTVGELASNMGKVIPIAAAYNVEMNNLSTSYAVMTANGIATAESTTYMKAMFNELGDSGSDVAKTLKEQTGKSFSELMKSGKSVGDIIQILGNAVKNDTTAFNQLWSSSEAGVGALSLLGAGAKGFNEVLEQMNNSAGATEEAFNKMADTTEMAKNKMLTSLDNLKIAIGEELNPQLEEMYETGTDAFTWASEFVEENPEVVSAITALTTGLAVLTIGITAASAATVAFSTALTFLKEHPMILIVSALAAATVALGTFVAMERNAADQTDEFIEKKKEEIEALKESTEVRKSSEEEHHLEIESLNKLKDTVVELSKKERLNTEEKADMLNAVSKLNQAMPELNLEIDKNTGNVKGNTDALESNIDAKLRSYEISFMEEDLKQIAEDRWNAEKTLLELQDERANKQIELQELEKEYAEYLERNKETIEENTQVHYAAAQPVDEYSAKIQQAKLSLVNYDEQIRESREVFSTATEDFENMSDAMDSMTTSTEEVGNKIVEYKDTIYNVSGEVATSIDGIKTAYLEAKDEAYQSISAQVGLFEELQVKSDLTASQMAENLKTQTDTYNTYASDLKVASELMEADTSGNFKGVLQNIMDMGVSGAGYLHELVTAAEEDAGKFAEVVASFGDMEAAKENLAETLGDIQSGYTEQVDAILGITTEKCGELEGTFTTSYDNIQKNIEEVMQSMVTSTDNGIADMAGGIESGTKQLVSSAELMCASLQTGMEAKFGLNKDGEYTMFSKIGVRIDESIAAGITQGASYIEKAMQDAVDDAVDSIDFSKLSNKVDRALGSAFS